MTDPPELIPVPTVQELLRSGLATSLSTDKQGNTIAAVVSSKGNAVMVEAMMENGRRLRERDESTRKPIIAAPVNLIPPDDPWFDVGSHELIEDSEARRIGEIAAGLTPADVEQ